MQNRLNGNLCLRNCLQLIAFISEMHPILPLSEVLPKIPLVYQTVSERLLLSSWEQPGV